MGTGTRQTQRSAKTPTKAAARVKRAPETKRLLTVPEAARELDIGERKTWSLVQQGQLGSIKIGKLRRVPREAIETFIQSQYAAVMLSA